MKSTLIIFFGLFCLAGSANGQTDKETLRKAIGYYQQLKFDKSIELFDEMVEASPDDVSLIGRRGYVIAEYVRSMDENKVTRIDSAMYLDLISKGMADLKKSLAKYPNNVDNKTSLMYLEKKG